MLRNKTNKQNSIIVSIKNLQKTANTKQPHLKLNKTNIKSQKSGGRFKKSK